MKPVSGTRAILVTWILLLCLLGLTIAVSFRLTGFPSLAAGLAIAATKAALILWVFMHLREVGGLLRVTAAAGFAWLAILLALGGLAYL